MVFISMIIMVFISMIIMVFISMIIVAVSMSMNDSVKVFSLSINSRRSDGSFNGKNTIVGQSPFENVTKLAINSVVLRIAIEIGLKTSMTLNGDHRSDLEFTLGNLFTTTMSAMGMNPADCSITSQQ